VRGGRRAPAAGACSLCVPRQVSPILGACWRFPALSHHYGRGRRELAKIAALLQRPGLRQNTPEYQCNSDCGNPNIGLKDKNKYPKAFLIRFVSWHLAAHNWLAVPRLVQSLMPNCSMCFCRMCFCGQVIDVVVDIRMWADVFNAIKPTLNSITQIGTFCRDLAMPLDAPDNCEAELPFFVMNITNEGQEGYVYMQHTSMWDYSRGSGAGK